MPWIAVLECSLHRIIEWHPTTAFHIIYTESSILFRYLSSRYLCRVSELQIDYVQEENNITHQLCNWQGDASNFMKMERLAEILKRADHLSTNNLIELKHDLDMLSIFMNHTAKTSILDDFNFYENLEKARKEKRSGFIKSDYEVGEKGKRSLTQNLSLDSQGLVVCEGEQMDELGSISIGNLFNSRSSFPRIGQWHRLICLTSLFLLLPCFPLWLQLTSLPTTMKLPLSICVLEGGARESCSI